jgi:hypothetical protein
MPAWSEAAGTAGMTIHEVNALSEGDLFRGAGVVDAAHGGA